MRWEIKNPGGNVITLLRKVGYFKQQEAFVRPLEKSGYPRFHLYLDQKKENLVFDLHLDQKKPSYKGTARHSGEYNSPIVQEEAQRIKQILNE